MTRLAARRSVRRFRPDAVERDLVERLLAAAVTAPSAGNKQPWRFVVVTDRDVVRRMATAVGQAVDRLAEDVIPESRDGYRSYARSFLAFAEAPVVIVVLSRDLALLSHVLLPGSHERHRATVQALEHDAALASAAMAVQNLLLMAAELGLGATPMTGPLLAAREICGILGVRRSWFPVALVAAGHADESPEPPGRKGPGLVTRWIEPAQAGEGTT